ncbi:MAG: hypothetical protein KF708_02105 [Pirellulales bacterium]|nr:hypothetical protein [Pirellulales bacterium]
MRRTLPCLLVPAFALSAIAVAGCGASNERATTQEEHFVGDGHDHESTERHASGHLTASDIELPADFDAAIVRIKTCRETVTTAVDSGNLEGAHAPIDELTLVLEKVMPLARDGGIPREHWKEINTLAQKMIAHVETLHVAVEQGQKPQTENVEIDEAIARLEVIAQAPRADRK